MEDRASASVGGRLGMTVPGGRYAGEALSKKEQSPIERQLSELAANLDALQGAVTELTSALSTVMNQVPESPPAQPAARIVQSSSAIGSVLVEANARIEAQLDRLRAILHRIEV